MPTYEYECTECGKVCEIFQSMSEPTRRRLKKSDPKPCDCDAPVTRRIGTGGGIIFKGSGFYQTDYRTDSYKKAAKADADSGKAKSETAGESKSEAKKDSAPPKNTSPSPGVET
jgi:putative FmdB family regulatory protein